jgi:mono/diheme cytochrome c family protein
VSGRPLSENVRKQLIKPYKNMPSFADQLTAEQRNKLIAYLKTL